MVTNRYDIEFPSPTCPNFPFQVSPIHAVFFLADNSIYSFIGCVATCGALVMSAVKMRAGKSTDMNYWLRARVVLQGVTIVALVAWYMSLQEQRKRAEEVKGVTEETKMEKEKEEFESRLRVAQAAYEEALAGKTFKGSTVKSTCTRKVVRRRGKRSRPREKQLLLRGGRILILLRRWTKGRMVDGGSRVQILGGRVPRREEAQGS